MSDISRLPPAERLKRYRELQQEALREAERSGATHAEAYLRLAKGWAHLAEVTDHLISEHATAPPEVGVEQREAALRAPRNSDEPDDPKP